jgi:uncharacterized membrane protein YgcG
MNELRMKRVAFPWLLLAGVCCGCLSTIDDAGQESSSTGAALAASTASGVVPAGLPARVLVGLFEDSGQTWMKSSGVKWDARYRYFTKGWVNNWGYSAYDGSWGLAYLRECDQQGFVPAVQYYQINGEAGGSESAFLSKVQNATTMKSYFGDFKILMQRVKDFGKPALILLEADGYGFLEQQSNGNSSTYAAVAASGVPELSGLPNTVAGWGLAFLQLRKSVGASNAILGIHISAWASGKDISYFNVTDALSPEVDKVYAFLAPFGLSTNATGQTYDVLVGDPLDRDSDYYRLTQNQNRWWDASDSASISSASFNRYAAWLQLWNQKAAKRWILWQIPIGNSNSKNVANNGGAAEGYKDNRPEYFFANGTAHISKFADSGVIALLFGAGAGGQSSYQNDTYTDGQLFLKSRAGAILAAGGVPIATGSGGGTGGSGGSGGSAGSGGTSGSGGSGGAGGSGGSGATCTATQGTGSGLRGDYFGDRTLTSLVTSRTDATVNFDWGTGSPVGGVGSDNFSVRWTGQVSPRFSGSTKFYTRSDDGIRLWVNGQLLVDNWTNHGPTENSGSITLNAGQRYDVKIEYYENTGGAVASLSWSSTCETKQIVPAAQLYPPAVSSDGSQYNFESSAQSWSSTGGMLTSVASSTDRAFAGSHSLKLTFGGSAADTQRARVSTPSTPAGATVTFHVYLPSSSAISAVQPYVLQGASGNWTWTGAWRSTSSLSAGQWNTISVSVPSNAATPLAELGVEFTTNASWSGAAYVDAVAW